jgi:REP element-mobilizing transposase RayT
MKRFEKEADYIAFEKVLEQTWKRIEFRILSYCLMPNHITCYSGHVRTENFPR